MTQKQLMVYSLPLHGENSESCNLELRAYLWAALLAAECLVCSPATVQCLYVYRRSLTSLSELLPPEGKFPFCGNVFTTPYTQVELTD